MGIPGFLRIIRINVVQINYYLTINNIKEKKRTVNKYKLKTNYYE